MVPRVLESRRVVGVRLVTCAVKRASVPCVVGGRNAAGRRGAGAWVSNKRSC